MSPTGPKQCFLLEKKIHCAEFIVDRFLIWKTHARCLSAKKASQTGLLVAVLPATRACKANFGKSLSLFFSLSLLLVFINERGSLQSGKIVCINKEGEFTLILCLCRHSRSELARYHPLGITQNSLLSIPDVFFFSSLARTFVSIFCLHPFLSLAGSRKVFFSMTLKRRNKAFFSVHLSER